MLAQLVTSFFASASFGVIFNAPKQALLKCGLVGMVGWIIYFTMVEYQVDSVPASLTASFFVAIISSFFARKYKMPTIIFIVGGIIPLVPGGLAYNSMRNFVSNHYDIALQLAAKVVLIAGAIAMGIVCSEVLNQIIKKVRLRYQKTLDK